MGERLRTPLACEALLIYPRDVGILIQYSVSVLETVKEYLNVESGAALS